MPFGVVSGVGRGMGVLDGVADRRREGTVLVVNLGRPIITNGAFATRLFSNYFEDFSCVRYYATLFWQIKMFCFVLCMHANSSGSNGYKRCKEDA